MKKDDSVSGLNAHLGYRLRMVSNAVSRSFARKVEAEGTTVAEWVFLRVLFDIEPAAPSALADGMGMTRGAISKLANRLIEKRLIGREDRTDDRRGRTLALTERARKLVPRLAAQADANDAEFFDALNIAERKQLDGLLGKIISAHNLTATPTD